MKKETILKEWKNIFEKYVTAPLENGWMEQPMESLGLNSFDAITLLIDIEEKFQVSIDDDLIEPEMFVSPVTMFDRLEHVLTQNSISK